MNRPPYTEDWVCRVHYRPGSHPDEVACPAYIFAPVSDAAKPEDLGPIARPPAASKKYRKRPDPPEVEAVAVGALMLVNTGHGPEYTVPRDQFFATYEEVIEPREEAEEATERMQHVDAAHNPDTEAP